MKWELPKGYKVVYDHYLEISKRPPLGGLYKVMTMKTVAHVFVDDPSVAEIEVATGEALVNPNYDSYNRKVGNEIALGRALKALKTESLTQV